MQQGHLRKDTEQTLDRAAAEQALLIAARLQHEHKERMSVTEIKQTAAEVDIAPEFVDQALSLMQRKPEPPEIPEIHVSATPTYAWLWDGIVNSVVGFIGFTAQFFLMLWIVGGRFEAVFPAWVTVGVSASLAGYFFPKGRRWPQVLAVSALVASVLVLCNDWNHYEWVRIGMRMIVEKMALAAALEVFTFALAQKLADLTRSEPARRRDVPSAQA